jgi:hypothetical protein
MSQSVVSSSFPHVEPGDVGVELGDVGVREAVLAGPGMAAGLDEQARSWLLDRLVVAGYGAAARHPDGRSSRRATTACPFPWDIANGRWPAGRVARLVGGRVDSIAGVAVTQGGAFDVGHRRSCRSLRRPEGRTHGRTPRVLDSPRRSVVW